MYTILQFIMLRPIIEQILVYNFTIFMLRPIIEQILVYNFAIFKLRPISEPMLVYNFAIFMLRPISEPMRAYFCKYLLHSEWPDFVSVAPQVQNYEN
jgi:hypothetical protein